MLMAVVLVLSLGIFMRHHHSRLQGKEKDSNIVERVHRARSIIDFTFAGPVTIRDRLSLRSRPNQRLIQTFGINNSFTTTSVSTHLAFVRMASASLSITNQAWQQLFHQAQHYLKHEVSEALIYGDSRLQLAPFVRHLSLRVVLSILFKVEPLAPSKSDVSAITQEINEQWMRSKSGHKRFTRSSRLATSLSNLNLRASDGETIVTPEQALGLILPAYETLWRVVLLTFVTGFYRQYNHSITKKLDEVPDCLGVSGKEAEALKFAKEGLRLYPSTKRVYRTDPTSSAGLEISADVEWCHRSPEIWGADSLAFRPDRFDSLTSLQKDAYLPFGLRPHKCPAFGGFGERLVAMLVAVLGQELPATVATIQYNDRTLDIDGGQPLPTGRGEMESWALILRD